MMRATEFSGRREHTHTHTHTHTHPENTTCQSTRREVSMFK